MPYRMTAWAMVAAVVGAVVVGVLLVLRRDVHRAAANGPAWRRGLLTTGIALFGSLGIFIPTGCGPTVKVTCYINRDVMARMNAEKDLTQLRAKACLQLERIDPFIQNDTIDRPTAREVLLECERTIAEMEKKSEEKSISEKDRDETRFFAIHARVTLCWLRMKLGYDPRALRCYPWNEALAQEHERQERATTRPASATRE
ncbi:MAG: hypothetical protein ABFD92_14230 [Planctomycetaceae bacterium]|nr:hypothetical protein [Planctomycetaceae bacterium]